MSNYATYTDFSYYYYLTTGKTLAGGQQTVVTAILTDMHDIITDYLKSEPAVNGTLQYVEVQMALIAWDNEENKPRGIEPKTVLPDHLKSLLDLKHEGGSDDVLVVVTDHYSS